MIEVFKTNITKAKIAKNIKSELLSHFPEFVIHFDLEDCDRVLRIENCRVPESVLYMLRQKGIYCEVLE